MKSGSALAFVVAILAVPLWGADRYPVTGLILKIDRAEKSFVASCDKIPGYMEAMAMPYSVRDEKLLDGLEAGVQVDFTLVVEKDDAYVEALCIQRYVSGEQEPLRARRLQLLESLANPAGAPATLAVGQSVPDFTLTDQTGRAVALSQFAGKIVGITFFYTSCPLPNFCYRLSNNFGRLQKRFASRMGKNLVLLSITIDPVHDQPEILTAYANTWKADANSWHFLTGPLADVKAVGRRFGVNFWPEEGALTHSLHTVLLDGNGRVAANLEGNQFGAVQLGDLVEELLSSRR